MMVSLRNTAIEVLLPKESFIHMRINLTSTVEWQNVLFDFAALLGSNQDVSNLCVEPLKLTDVRLICLKWRILMILSYLHYIRDQCFSWIRLWYAMQLNIVKKCSFKWNSLSPLDMMQSNRVLKVTYVKKSLPYRILCWFFSVFFFQRLSLLHATAITEDKRYSSIKLITYLD